MMAESKQCFKVSIFAVDVLSLFPVQQTYAVLLAGQDVQQVFWLSVQWRDGWVQHFIHVWAAK